MKPVREDGRGRPAENKQSETFINRLINTPPAETPAPSVINKIAAAPEAAQEAIAEAVQEKKLTRQETAALVEAVKSAPPEQQAEVAKIAAVNLHEVAKQRGFR